MTNRGQHTEGIFAHQLVYLLLESIFLTGNTADIVFRGVAVVGSLGAAALGCPYFLVGPAQGHFLTVHIQYSFHRCQSIMVLYLAVCIQRLDFNVLLAVALAIFSEKQPGQCIINAGLTGGVVSIDSSVAAHEIQRQVIVALEIFKVQPLNFDFGH